MHVSDPVSVHGDPVSSEGLVFPAQKNSGLPYAGARAPRGGVTRQGVVLTHLPSLLDCQ